MIWLRRVRFTIRDVLFFTAAVGFVLARVGTPSTRAVIAALSLIACWAVSRAVRGRGWPEYVTRLCRLSLAVGGGMLAYLPVPVVRGAAIGLCTGSMLGARWRWSALALIVAGAADGGFALCNEYVGRERWDPRYADVPQILDNIPYRFFIRSHCGGSNVSKFETVQIVWCIVVFGAAAGAAWPASAGLGAWKALAWASAVYVVALVTTSGEMSQVRGMLVRDVIGTAVNREAAILAYFASFPLALVVWCAGVIHAEDVSRRGAVARVEDTAGNRKLENSMGDGEAREQVDCRTLTPGISNERAS